MSNNQNPGYGQNNPQYPNYPQGGYPPQAQRPGYPTGGQQPNYMTQGQNPNYPPRSYSQQGGYRPQGRQGFGGAPQGGYPRPPQKPRSGANVGLIIGGAIIAVLVLAIIAALVTRGRSELKVATPPEPTQTTSAPKPTTQPTTTTEPTSDPTSAPTEDKAPSGETVDLTPGDISIGVPSGWTVSNQESDYAVLENDVCVLAVSSGEVVPGVSATSLVQQLGDNIGEKLEDFQWGYGPEAIDLGAIDGSAAEGGATGTYVDSSGSVPMYIGFAALVSNPDMVGFAQQLRATNIDDYNACVQSAGANVLGDAADSLFG